MKVGTDSVMLGAWVEIGPTTRILDIGTGSGLLALMMAQRCKAIIDAVEIDSFAADEARMNAGMSPWKERLNIITSSFQSFSMNSPYQYELILSNPPYFSNSLKPADQGKINARHDEHLSLPDLLSGIAKLLNPQGKAAIVLPFDSLDRCKLLASHEGLYPLRECHITSREGKDPSRFLIELCSHNLIKVPKEEIVVRDKKGLYTAAYKDLTSEFYLGL
jgi:tRNA1Val (adenine37-N6)-methyltransferase